ncbi:MAG TPA: PH domain-containing protein [Sphingomonadaceae bacterium]|nr:PH domain-containing protein [Sphingomonadaceae bacterium]
MDEDEKLTRLHPNHVKVLRIGATIAALPVLVAGLVGEIVARTDGVLFPGAVLLPVMALLTWLVFFLPWRRYSARGYQMGADRLRVVKGILFHKDTVIPFGRVQHIDVERGPVERYFGLATLILHTAGTHNASVSLPGLAEGDAIAMREAIRAKIRQDTL